MTRNTDKQDTATAEKITTMRPSRTSNRSAASTDAPSAVIYVRVSTEEQAMTDTDDGYSLPHQVRQCRKAAKDRDAAVLEEFTEAGQSGRSLRRPQLEAALRFVEQHDVDFFVVHKINRFARDVHDAMKIKKRLAKAGCKLISAVEHFDDSAFGTFMEMLLHAEAQLYSDRLSEEVASKMGEKARRGGTPNKAPLGYLNVRKEIEGVPNVATVEIDEERAPHIRWAFNAFATGNWTTRSMVDELEQRGLRLRKTRTHPERPIQRSHLHRLLRNPYYIGMVVWAGEQYPGKHPALVSLEVWERVQRVLEANDSGGDKSSRYTPYLKGVLFCGHCQSRLGFVHGRGNGGEYEYFFCYGRQNRNGCPQRYIPIDDAARAVENYYPAVMDRLTKQLPAIETAIQELLTGHEAQRQSEKERAARDLARLERQEERLMADRYDDTISPELFKREMTRIRNSVQQARTTAEAADTDLGDLNQRFNQLVTLARKTVDTYHAASETERRQLNQFWFSKLYLKDRDITEHQLAELPQFITSQNFQRSLDRSRKIFHRAATEPDWDWDTALQQLAENEQTDRDAVPAGHGSILIGLVEVTGLEPVASSMRPKRSSQTELHPRRDSHPTGGLPDADKPLDQLVPVRRCGANAACG